MGWKVSEPSPAGERMGGVRHLDAGASEVRTVRCAVVARRRYI